MLKYLWLVFVRFFVVLFVWVQDQIRGVVDWLLPELPMDDELPDHQNSRCSFIPASITLDGIPIDGFGEEISDIPESLFGYPVVPATPKLDPTVPNEFFDPDRGIMNLEWIERSQSDWLKQFFDRDPIVGVDEATGESTSLSIRYVSDETHFTDDELAHLRELEQMSLNDDDEDEDFEDWSMGDEWDGWDEDEILGG